MEPVWRTYGDRARLPVAAGRAFRGPVGQEPADLAVEILFEYPGVVDLLAGDPARPRAALNACAASWGLRCRSALRDRPCRSGSVPSRRSQRPSCGHLRGRPWAAGSSWWRLLRTERQGAVGERRLIMAELFSVFRTIDRLAAAATAAACWCSPVSITRKTHMRPCCKSAPPSC
jgi:hypothetical protein